MDAREAFLGRLQERGVPLAAIVAVDMNVQDESGWDPAANEASPVVPGSRGGFGLMQWTGPRREALEQFAAQQGRSPADPELQADFFLMEAEGPEKAAWSATLSQNDPGQAAATFAKKFLRPAHQHLARRTADYTGTRMAGDYGNALSGTGFNPNASYGNALTAYLDEPKPPEVPQVAFNPSTPFDPRYAMRFS